MAPTSEKLRHLYSLKDKLYIILEWETCSLGCKGVDSKYRMHPCQLREWKKKIEGILEKASAIKDVTLKHTFLSKMSCHEGWKPETDIMDLERVREVYDDIMERDGVVTLSLLAHDLRRRNVSLQDLSVRSVFCQVY
jgi:hypothetical protein